MKLLSVFMDVEDPINPLADDAALEIADLFSGAGVIGSFCVTGEKCRTLIRRDRTDVIKALSRHCLGLHTDTHSYHPTTMELLAELNYEEGCQAAFVAEERGVRAFESAFGRQPAFWGGAGNTWSPEITDALRRLSIPAYVYALTELPNSAVHRFGGVFALPQSVSVSELEWCDPELASKAESRALAQIDAVPAEWVGVFVGHPTKMRHERYWDWPYFAGRTPDEPETTPPIPEERYRFGLRSLAAFLGKIRDSHSVIGVDAALRLDWSVRKPTESARQHFKTATAANLRSAASWPPHRSGLSPERIVEKTLSLIDTLEFAHLPTARNSSERSV